MSSKEEKEATISVYNKIVAIEDHVKALEDRVSALEKLLTFETTLTEDEKKKIGLC